MRSIRDTIVISVGWAARAALDLILPPQCPTCDAVVDEPGRFCPGCFRKADLIIEPCCRRCGVGFVSVADAGLSRVCAPCIATPPPWQHARAAFSYDDFSKQLILPLKYADRTENAGFLARHMVRAGGSLLEQTDLLLPVPLHRGRLFSRRYNQAALLAQHVGRLSRRPVLVDGLARTRATRSLTSCAPGERAAAIAGAIVCRRHRVPAIAGRRVTLVDDVLTTGSTASVCVDALLAAGAASVDLLVAARAAARAA